MNNVEFLELLHSISSLQFGEFTLASGAKSEFYLDLRVIPYYPDLLQRLIQDFIQRKLNKLHFDIVCGIPSAGVPFATLIAYFCKKPLIMLRKKIKKHGLAKLIEGGPIQDKKVLVVDDLISSGFSKEPFINNLRENGAIIVNLAVILDRRNKNKVKDHLKWEEKMGISVISLYELSKDTIMNFKVSKGSKGI